MVCLSVCLSVGHVRELCKNGWTDRDAAWGEANSGRPRNHVLDGSPDPKGKGNFGGCSLHLKAREAFAAVYAKRLNRLRCGMTHMCKRRMYWMGSRSHILICRRERRCGLLSKFFDHLLLQRLVSVTLFLASMWASIATITNLAFTLRAQKALVARCNLTDASVAWSRVTDLRRHTTLSQTRFWMSAFSAVVW